MVSGMLLKEFVGGPVALETFRLVRILASFHYLELSYLQNLIESLGGSCLPGNLVFHVPLQLFGFTVPSFFQLMYEVMRWQWARCRAESEVLYLPL